jgi:4-hydroxythreonine-4-phosphate dehydrogenase
MDLFVVADDRTGAWETAAALADAGAGPIEVVVWPAVPRGRIGVIDVGTRHLTPAEARERVASMPPAGRTGHKIDSTLRGNWPEELAAWTVTAPVLLIPALPVLGRTCVDGVVLDHGRPVHDSSAGSDVRRRVTTSRPAESLIAAGVTDVEDSLGVDDVMGWLEHPGGVRIADASDGDTIAAMVGAWSAGPADVVLAGTSAVIAAAAPFVTERRPPETFESVSAPVLIACGSVHPAARAQLADVARRGVAVVTLADDVTVRALAESRALVLATEIPVGDVGEPLAVAAATTLARGVDELCRRVVVGALIVIGGDTAAAVFGDAPATVHGSVAPGTAWASVGGFDLPIVTRAGGFGGEGALFDLINGMLRP